MRGSPRTLLSGAAAAAALALAFVLSSPEVRQREEPHADLAVGVPAPRPRPVPAPVAPVAATRAQGECGPPAPSADPRRALRAVDELSELLRGIGYDPTDFERGVQALAAQLDPEQIPELVGRFSDPSTPSGPFVSAAALLRALHQRGNAVSGLPRSALDRLGALAFSPGDDAAGDVAAAALARLGTAWQRRVLLQQVLTEDGAPRERAARALRQAPASDLAYELARAPWPSGDPRADELMVLMARRLLRGDDASMGAPGREVLRGLLVTFADHPSDGKASARARAALEEDRRSEVTALGTLLDAGAARELRGEAARVVAAAPLHVPAAARREAARVLAEEARAGDAATRRRALYALASLGEREGLHGVLEAAREDPDPAVRAAGLRALRALPADERRAALEEAARSDGSRSVRALARSELARAE